MHMSLIPFVTLLLASTRAQRTCFIVRLFIQFCLILQGMALYMLTDPLTMTIFIQMLLISMVTLLLASTRVRGACFFVRLFLRVSLVFQLLRACIMAAPLERAFLSVTIFTHVR